MGLYVLPGLRILLQICIPERKRFELRALEYLNTMAFIPKQARESHVRSALEFHLVFVAGGAPFACLPFPHQVLPPNARLSPTAQYHRLHMNAVPPPLAS